MTGALADKRGFTLTELMVVVGIIVLLTSIVVPNIASRITKARMTAAEQQIAAIEVALGAYHADFGTYPGDVFPSEDRNNDGVLDSVGGEDAGVDIDRDTTADYALTANGRLDHGDGVVNIDDLEWALNTEAGHGPYMETIPLDPWGSKYVYTAVLIRPVSDLDYLYIDPGDGTETNTLTSEDANKNGKLDAGEDIGIADYDLNGSVGDVVGGFRNMRAGAGNGILDHGDDDNKDDTIHRYITASPPPDRREDYYLELGNLDISPDGLSRNRGYYIYSVGRDKIDNTATGYEDINLNRILNDGNGGRPLVPVDGGTFNEDSINSNGSLDTGYEDTGVDGVPGTKDVGEGDLLHQTAEEFHNGHYNTTYDPNEPEETLDHGGDDINSWNKKRPWREDPSYGG